MCEFFEGGKGTSRGLSQSGRSVYKVFPVQVQLIPPESVKEEYCPFTGEWLSPNERHPQHAATSRHTKQYVYERLITPSDDTRCGLCGCGLEMETVNQFRANRREVAFRFCPECRDYFGLMAAVVHGDPVAKQVMAGPRQIAYEPQETMGDIINMVPVRQRVKVR
jgi:hypothetical protein